MWVARAFSLRDDELVEERPLPRASDTDIVRFVGAVGPLVGVAHIVPASVVAALAGVDHIPTDQVEWSLEFDAATASLAETGPIAAPRPGAPGETDG